MIFNENKLIGLQWINNLKALATFSVIVLHVTFPIVYRFGAIEMNDWYIGNFFDSLVRFCVPIFLMITGVLLLPKSIEIDSFLKKKLVRVVYPFLFWSLIYVLLNLVLKYNNEERLSVLELFKFLYLQFKDGASYHLWYVYMLIGIYLFLPVIGKWILNSNEKGIRYFLILWLVTSIFKQSYLSNYVPNVDLTYFSGYIGYPILGYYLARYITKSNILGISLLLFIIGTVFTMLGTFFLTRQNGVFSESFYNYLSPNVILCAIGVFLFFKEYKIRNARLLSVINFVSLHSYGIYLSHVLVLFFLNILGLNFSFFNPFVGIVLTSVICLFLSLIIVVLLKKTPYIKAVAS